MSNEQAQTIVKWYKDYTIEKGVEDVLRARQMLSLACVEISLQYKEKETLYRKLYTERKILEAVTKIETDGTVLHKEATAIVKSSELRLREAVAEGESKGTKIVLDKYNNVLSSMASFINTLNR